VGNLQADEAKTAGAARLTGKRAEPLYLLINLDRSADRLAIATERLGTAGIAFERLSAVDGAKLSLPMPGISPEVYKRCHGRPLRMAEVGCYLSHLQAMQRLLDSDHEYCVVFEDDVELEPAFGAVVADLVARDLVGFDMIRLQGRRPGLGFAVAQLPGPHRLKVMLTRVTGSSCYIIARRGARRFLDTLMPMQVPFDHAYNRSLHTGVRIGFVVPYVVSPENSTMPSTIESPRHERRKDDPMFKKVGPIEKLSVLRWRTESEISRGLAFFSEIGRRMVTGALWR